MKIKRPTPIVYDENYDESQITFMTETLIKKHLDYLKRVARPLGMTVKVKKLKSNNPNLDEQDNDLIDRFFPIAHIKIYDDDELLSEFTIDAYTDNVYESFVKWVSMDIHYYMVSKAMFLDFDKKFSKHINLKQALKKI